MTHVVFFLYTSNLLLTFVLNSYQQALLQLVSPVLCFLFSCLLSPDLLLFVESAARNSSLCSFSSCNDGSSRGAATVHCSVAATDVIGDRARAALRVHNILFKEVVAMRRAFFVGVRFVSRMVHHKDGLASDCAGIFDTFCDSTAILCARWNCVRKAYTLQLL